MGRNEVARFFEHVEHGGLRYFTSTRGLNVNDPSQPFSRDMGCQEPTCNISLNNSANYRSSVFTVVQLKFAGMRWNHSRDQRGDWLKWLGTSMEDSILGRLFRGSGRS